MSQLYVILIKPITRPTPLPQFEGTTNSTIYLETWRCSLLNTATRCGDIFLSPGRSYTQRASCIVMRIRTLKKHMILAMIRLGELANWHSFSSPTFCSSDPPQKPIHTPIHSNPWFLSSVYPRLCRFSARRSGTFSFGFSKILGLRAKSVQPTFLVMWGNHLQALIQLCTDCDAYALAIRDLPPRFYLTSFEQGPKSRVE